MTRPVVLPLSRCTDLALVGGKALGLARLLAAGFPVPHGICVTTEAYNQSLQMAGLAPEEEWQRACTLSGAERESALSDCQARIRQVDNSKLSVQWLEALQALDVPLNKRWAVRSSATNEDAGQTSFAGLYRTHLGIAVDQINAAIKDLWASLWQERVIQYTIERVTYRAAPSMAVVIQPMLKALASGVAYSIHPVTGRSFHVAVNAVPGLAAPLVDGQVTPDHYVVEMGADQQPVWIRRRALAHKSRRLTVTEEGLRHETIPVEAQLRSSLSDEQLFELGRTAKKIEQAFGYPVDLEWAIDSHRLWTLQARPVTGIRPSSELTNDDCEWSRANFKETMPELPSPLGLSFLESFMDVHILPHYRSLGCRIPKALSSVRTLHGRPYLNVTLFHILVGQLRGDPSLNIEQLGGEPLYTAPHFEPLNWSAFIRAGWLMWTEMQRVQRSGPRLFEEMKALASTYRRDRILHLSMEELTARLDKLGHWLDGREVTFGIAGGVGQCLQVFSKLLPRWLGHDWRSLLNAALQGQGTVISAQQILRLAEIAEIARRDPETRTFFAGEPWNPAEFRTSLKGTAFLRAFEAYMEDYGHRGVGESDIMSPRLADSPETILTVLRAQVSSASPSREAIQSRQDTTSSAALDEIKRRIGWRLHRWVAFLWLYRRLCRFFALREANRHHLMYYSTATRNLLLRLGELLIAQGVLTERDDIFLLTMEDQAHLASGEKRDWNALIQARWMDRERNAAIQVPDTIRDWEMVAEETGPSGQPGKTGLLSGLPISAGSVVGPVRLIRSLSDWGNVTPGDILVAAVIDPGMAPLFGIAGGLIVEMGGTLSHGAIIAREYGLPTVANVQGAMARLAEGQRVRLDAGAGTIRLEPES